MKKKGRKQNWTKEKGLSQFGRGCWRKITHQAVPWQAKVRTFKSFPYSCIGFGLSPEVERTAHQEKVTLAPWGWGRYWRDDRRLSTDHIPSSWQQIFLQRGIGCFISMSTTLWLSCPYGYVVIPHLLSFINTLSSCWSLSFSKQKWSFITCMFPTLVWAIRTYTPRAPSLWNVVTLSKPWWNSSLISEQDKLGLH